MSGWGVTGVLAVPVAWTSAWYNTNHHTPPCVTTRRTRAAAGLESDLDYPASNTLYDVVQCTTCANGIEKEQTRPAPGEALVADKVCTDHYAMKAVCPRTVGRARCKGRAGGRGGQTPGNTRATCP